ncbi:MAG: dependent oxidoreductase, partial [Candidatus Krumholzibacteriota bacterium]|nr:dependent oxidoreductase [Candidatus Krumholzibacteriota bacterium]
IVGGGVNGLAAAYNLARRGVKNIVVLEKGYIGSGDTGRCGAGIRQQWGLEENIVLARESLKIYEKLSGELGFNIFFRQGGYLVLVFDEEERELVSRTIPLQNKLGVPTRLLSVPEVVKRVPGINAKGLLGAAFCPTDGMAYPYAVLWGYAEAARRLGVEIKVHTRVTALARRNDWTYDVVTEKDTFNAPVVVNVAGARSREIGAMIGIEIPTKPVRHEIAVTESLKPFLGPMIISPKKGFYFSQSLRGEIVGGIGDPNEPPSYNTKSSPDFLFRYASALRETLPPLGKARIIRQWAGHYDMSPDHRPIIGTVEGYKGYYHACGFSGHGFMLAPIVARLLAELITTGKTSLPIDALALTRFAKGEIAKDPYVVG